MSETLNTRLRAHDGVVGTTLYLQMDNCATNKNWTVFGFLAYLLLLGVVNCVEIYFMQVVQRH